MKLGRRKKKRTLSIKKIEETTTAAKESPSKAPSSRVMVGIFILGLFYTLYFVRDFILSIVLAILFSFMFRPIHRILVKAKIPKSLSAAFILIVFISVVVLGITSLVMPARAWIADAPQHLQQIEYKVRRFMSAEQMSNATQRVDKLTDPDTAGVQKVEIKQQSLGDVIFDWMKNFMISAFIMLIFLYFLLVYGDNLIRKLATSFFKRHDQKMIYQIAQETEQNISRYILTVAIINIVLGIATTAAMFFLKMPNPMLWGLMGCFLNFIPYIGACIAVALLGLAALIQFDLPYAAAIPLAYWLLTTIESSFITPIVLGRSFKLNPFIVFIAIAFWGSLWGITGMFVAVPILMTFKILCDHVENLKPVSEFLSD